MRLRIVAVFQVESTSGDTCVALPKVNLFGMFGSNYRYGATTLKTGTVIPSEVEESRAFRVDADPSLRLRSGQASSG